MSLLVISAGHGPEEVVRFARLLAARMVAEAGGEPVAEGRGSVTVRVSDGRGWVGVHQLVAPLRGRGERRRWFVAVTEVAEPVARSFDVRRVEWRADRAGGPGGQNVNRRATAVRAVDPESGARVRAAGRRGQGQNRGEALRRLEQAVTRGNEAAVAEAEAQRRRAHLRLRRGEPDFRWRLDARGGLETDSDERVAPKRDREG